MDGWVGGRSGGEEARSEGLVEDDEDGPDGNEDEEGVLGGGETVAGDCGDIVSVSVWFDREGRMGGCLL